MQLTSPSQIPNSKFKPQIPKIQSGFWAVTKNLMGYFFWVHVLYMVHSSTD